MRLSENEFEELQKRMNQWKSAPPLPVKMAPEFKEAVKQAQKKNLTIVLPFKLPTWNALLAMNHWKRKKVRDFIHSAVSMCIAAERDCVTLTASQQKQLSTDLY